MGAKQKPQNQKGVQKAVEQEATSSDNVPQGPQSADEWFEKLPENTLWKQERNLRGNLFRWMREQREIDDEDPLLLEQAERDPAVAASVRKLLGKFNIPIQEWIERRLPEDVAAGIDDQDRLVLFPLVPLEQYE